MVWGLWANTEYYQDILIIFNLLPMKKMSLNTKAVGRKQMTLRSSELSNNVKCHLYLGGKLDTFENF